MKIKIKIKFPLFRYADSFENLEDGRWHESMKTSQKL